MILEPNHVCHVRLINSDEVFGKYITETKETYIINIPMAIQQDESTVMLSRYVPFNDKVDVEFQKIHVLTITPVNPQFERYYYASVKYNKQFIEKNVLDNINNVSRVMEGRLDSDLREIILSPGQVRQLPIESLVPLQPTLH